MTAPRVSVALASYNGERYVAEQLRSILSQSRPPDEVVVSDGGSSDATVRVAETVLAEAPSGIRTRVVSDGTRLLVGPNFARAIAATTGELIVLSDQDDLWSADRIEHGMSAFGDERVLLAHADAQLVDADGGPIGGTLFGALGVRSGEIAQLRSDAAFALLIRRNLVTGATAMFRRNLLEAAEPFPADWVHDEWLAILAAATGRLFADPHVLIAYRQHGENEIGAAAPTFRYRIARVLESRGDRNAVLARRAETLRLRLDKLGAPARWRDLARRKAEFEERRAAFGARRLQRVLPVLRELCRGSYRDLSSQGRLDLARDILQAE